MSKPDFRLIEREIDLMLGSVKAEFTVEEEGEVRHFLDVGEYGLVLETFCDIAFERNKKLTGVKLGKIAELAQTMGLDEGTWRKLKG
jgi:hypothetical protein